MAVDQLEVELELLETEASKVGPAPKPPESEEPGAPDDAAAEATGGGDAAAAPPPKPNQPPPLSASRARARKQAAKAFAGRTRFDDLFVVEKVDGSAAVGSVDDKLNYFREKLKVAETQVSKFKEAWEIREREMDTVEGLLAREKNRADHSQKRADTAQQSLDRLQSFIDEKKKEFESYAAQATQAFADLQEKEKKTRQSLEQLERQAADDKEELEERIAALEREQAIRAKALEKLKKLSDAQRRALQERQAQIDELLEESEHVASEAARIREAGGQAEDDLRQRDDVIRKLKVALKGANNSLAQLEESVDEKSNEVFEAQEAQRQIQSDLEEARKQLRQTLTALENARGREADVREEIQGLKAKLEQVQRLDTGSVDKEGEERLARALLVANKLVGDLEQQTEEVLDDLFDAAGSAGEWPDEIGEVLSRLRKTLEISLRLLRE